MGDPKDIILLVGICAADLQKMGFWRRKFGFYIHCFGSWYGNFLQKLSQEDTKQDQEGSQDHESGDRNTGLKILPNSEIHTYCI